MNNNLINNSSSNYPVHHAPYIVDINGQRGYRRWGYVSNKETNIPSNNNNEEVYAINNAFPVFHSPLIFDINTQRTYRKPGFSCWPDCKNEK